MIKFKDIMQGQYFVYELFKDNHIQCIKKKKLHELHLFC